MFFDYKEEKENRTLRRKKGENTLKEGHIPSSFSSIYPLHL
jgi:hypothetical protein